jgi:hypothetical protein
LVIFPTQRNSYISSRVSGQSIHLNCIPFLYCIGLDFLQRL